MSLKSWAGLANTQASLPEKGRRVTWGEKCFPADVPHGIDAFDIGILEFVH